MYSMCETTERWFLQFPNAQGYPLLSSSEVLQWIGPSMNWTAWVTLERNALPTQWLMCNWCDTSGYKMAMTKLRITQAKWKVYWRNVRIFQVTWGCRMEHLDLKENQNQRLHNYQDTIFLSLISASLGMWLEIPLPIDQLWGRGCQL